MSKGLKNRPDGVVRQLAEQDLGSGRQWGRREIPPNQHPHYRSPKTSSIS
jgi:hypothetical protein